MSNSSERQRLEGEYERLNYLWEEEVFSAHPDWEELEQWDLELRGGRARAGPAGAGGKGSESASRLTRTGSRERGPTAARWGMEGAPAGQALTGPPRFW